MFDMNDKTSKLIKKTCRGKKHLKLTVGYLKDKNYSIKVYDENGEADPFEKYFYEIGSVTKTFTISLLSKYIFEKRMSLNDSIQKYIDGLAKNEYYPTLLRLATHSSGYSMTLPLSKKEYFKIVLGLIRGSGDTKKNNILDMDSDKMRMLIEKNKLKNKDYPWKYSNFGMALIGYALGVVSHRGYWDTMNDFIQNELGLKDTHLGTLNNNLHGYDSKNRDCGNWMWNKNNIISSAGGISSTARDLLEYAKINIYKDRPYLSQCYEKQGNINKKYDMGIGWLLLKKNNNIIWHSGGTGCFSTFLGFDINKKTAAVVLANYTLGRNDDQNIGFSLLESF